MSNEYQYEVESNQSPIYISYSVDDTYYYISWRMLDGE